MAAKRLCCRLRLRLGPLSAVLVLIGSGIPCSCQSKDEQAIDKATVQALVERVSELEARVRQLETARQEGKPSVSAGVSAPVQTPEPQAPPLQPRETSSLQHPAVIPGARPHAEGGEDPQAESAMNEQMDLSKTLLRIRGFGDVSFHGDTQQGDTTAFSLGQLDLFVTSDVSEHSRFLSEIVFEGGPDNIYGATVGPENSFSVDVERYLLQYSFNDYLNLSIGRGHTAIGYYNTAYHHSTWMQTTTARPFLFEFEDRGGILPVHIVGATASGRVPSGSLGLHYVAEIGNGRESRTPLVSEPVQNEVTDQNHKAFNLAVFARPDALRGFQTGFSVYRDQLNPASAAKIGETILAAHAILIRPKFEFLTEAVLDRHAPDGESTVYHTPGFYAQVSRQFKAYRPYFRYEYVNVPPHEPLFPDVALRHGPVTGLRYDANESVALKFEYNYTFLRNQPAVSGLTGQVGFTF
jgi:hypothetical protein